MTIGKYLSLIVQGIRLFIAMKRHAQGKHGREYNVGLGFASGRCGDRDLPSVFTISLMGTLEYVESRKPSVVWSCSTCS